MSRLIDADLLKRIICEDQCELPDGCGGSCEMTDYVEDAPTVEAEPVRHGHWELSHFKTMFICSCCRQYYISTDEAYDFNYCPHCGAKMDEVTT